MLLTFIARTAGLLGGTFWVVRYFSGFGALEWVGLVLLAVAMAGFGAALVSSSAVWLRVIVALALPLLVWSVVAVFHESGDDALIDAVFGGAVAVACAVALVRPAGRRTNSGSHSS